jgi:hypothetical protein
MKQLDIEPEHRAELLKAVGKDLHKITVDVGDGKKMPISYYDEQHDEWRMNMTPNAKMPQEALELIVRQAQEKGYLKNPIEALTDESTTTDSSTPTGNGQVVTPDTTPSASATPEASPRTTRRTVTSTATF